MVQRLLTFPADQIATLATESWHAFRGASRYREVPPLQPSMGLIAEAMLDRTFTVATSLMLGVPMPEEVRRQAEEAQAMRDSLAENGWLDKPLSYHRRPPALRRFELSPDKVRTGIRSQYYETLRFDSGFEPRVGEPGRERWLAHPNNGFAEAFVLEHEGAPRPWIVATHGFGMGTPLINSVGFPLRMLHEELGLNVVMPVLPLHGARGAGGVSGSEVMSPDYVQMVHLFTQAVWDVRRILGWVRARGGERIGLFGVSMGGYVSALVAALERHLEAVAVSIPMVDFTMAAMDNMPWIMRRYEDDIEIDWSVLRAITHVVSPLALTPRVPKSRRFIFAGIADRIVKPDQPRALWRHWGEPHIEWFSGGHVLGVFNRGLEPFLADALRRSGLVHRARRSRTTRRRSQRG